MSFLGGYPKEMDELINSNRGFQSRIQFYLDFPAYSEDELYKIFTNMMEQEQFKLDKKCTNEILDYFKNEIRYNKDNFSNGRLVRNLFEKVKFTQATRIQEQNSKNYNLITVDDITTVIEKIKSKPKTTIGFTA